MEIYMLLLIRRVQMHVENMFGGRLHKIRCHIGLASFLDT